MAALLGALGVPDAHARTGGASVAPTLPVLLAQDRGWFRVRATVTARRACVAALVALLLVGCGTETDDDDGAAGETAAQTRPSWEVEPAAVEKGFRRYLRYRGLTERVEVFKGGCIDKQFEREGLKLYECVVFVDGSSDASRYNVLYDPADGTVVDASPK